MRKLPLTPAERMERRRVQNQARVAKHRANKQTVTLRLEVEAEDVATIRAFAESLKLKAVLNCEK